MTDLFPGGQWEKSPEEFNGLRLAMVREQLEERGVRDPAVLAAMGKVPRERFVPDKRVSSAYEDWPLPIWEGQTISQPYIVAVMTELLELKRGRKVLEIGTGSGYQAAVLAELTDGVYSVEKNPPLHERAGRTLAGLGYGRVRLRLGDGYEGWEEHAPYDAIIVTAAPPSVPQLLLRQLAKGGRMAVPVGRGSQDLLLVRKSEDGGISEESVMAVRFVPMTDRRRA